MWSWAHLLGNAPLPSGSAGNAPPILPCSESNQLVCRAGLQVTGEIALRGVGLGTGWQVSLMGVLRAVLSCFLLVCSTLRFYGRKVRPRSLLSERSRVIISLGHWE